MPKSDPIGDFDLNEWDCLNMKEITQSIRATYLNTFIFEGQYTYSWFH